MNITVAIRFVCAFFVLSCAACSLKKPASQIADSLNENYISCDDPELGAYISKISEMTGHTSPWTKYRFDSIRVLIHKQGHRGALAYGFSDEELAMVNYESVPCAVSHHARMISLSVRFPDENGVYARIDGRTPFLHEHYTNTGYGDVANLSKIINLPVLTLLLPYTNEIPNDLPDEERQRMEEYLAHIEVEMASLVVHELFHDYQRSWAEDWGERDAAIACSENRLWWEAMSSELVDWVDYTKNVVRMNRSGVIELAKRVVNRRRLNANNNDVVACWQSIRGMERNEGTARFVDQAAALQNSLIGKDYWARQTLAYLEVQTPLEDGKEEFFYATGALLCDLLLQLAPDKSWQDRIEEGMAPDSMLEFVLDSLE